jgi:tetratricopeptide (TPR) repeat protein
MTMHERELERQRQQDQVEVDDRSAPGRASAAAGLARRDQPIASGILMRKAEGDALDATAAAQHAESSAGSQLPDALRNRFEASLGTDLSSVRVHTDTAANEAASAVSARAFATGQDVYFGAGMYDPSSQAGQHLIAHEVAHTVQQRGGSPAQQYKLAVSQPHDALEVEADRAADAMVSGRQAQVSSGGTTIARDSGFAPPPPPGLIVLKNLQPVAAAVKSGESSGQGSIPSPAGLFDKAESNYAARAAYATNLQAHYAASAKGVISDNHFMAGFAKTCGEANKYCENGSVLANAASSVINNWVPLLQNSQDAWAQVKDAAAKAGIETTANEDGSTSLDGEGVEVEGDQLKGYNKLVSAKDPKDPGPNASPQQKRDFQKQKESSDQDLQSGKNISSESKAQYDLASQAFQTSLTTMNRSRSSAVTKHGAARKSLVDARAKANAKRQSAAEEDKKNIDEIFAMVDKAQAAIEAGRGAVDTVGSFADTGDKMEKAIDGQISGVKASAIAKTILTLDGTIPTIEGEIAACKTRDENLKGIIDEGAIQSAGAEYAQALKHFKEDLKAFQTAATNYEKAHKAYAETVNQALIKRGVIKPGDDGVKPIMEVLAKVQVASAYTASALAATADVSSAVAAVSGIGAPPTPDLCKLTDMAASHAKAFSSAPKHVATISGVLSARSAKLKDYVGKLGI